ncbi:hypothetical protein [Brevibacterium luteolum]|uniref:hypothetical protein n=1 Tax=Brevibacterium luteolum TaxID=199591 RepID=UPI00223ACDF7|nr:hypothetical protein [Brevibacterium luteolum]MCT1658151.1 hypothetical protein [Brevibacterium luteolum]
MKRPFVQKELKQGPNIDSVSACISKSYAGTKATLTFTTRSSIKAKSLILTLAYDFGDDFRKDNTDWARSSLVDAWFKYFPEAEAGGERIQIELTLPAIEEDLELRVGKWGGNPYSPLTLLDETLEVSGILKHNRRNAIVRNDYTLLEKANR